VYTVGQRNLKQMQTGLVFNIQRYSVQDGPGIRATVFLKGCPLRCGWCHNPEGLAPAREVMVNEGRCCGCARCRLACPQATPGEGPLPARVAGCEFCGACTTACPADCRRIIGEEMTVADVLRMALQDRIFFEESNGGVTFSGGEPLMQPAFLRALLSACREEGVHTAIDTCGMAALEDLRAIVPFTDLFLFDLKFLDEETHRRYTGASNRRILENLEVLGRDHGNIWLRVPLIPGVNDDPVELARVARFAANLEGIRQVNVLPYHRTGLHKWERLGRVREGTEYPAASDETLAGAKAIFEDEGLTAKTGG